MNGLRSAEKISYLANVFAVCGTNGKFAPRELQVLKDIAQRLGVTPAEAASARALVAKGCYEPVLLPDGRACRDNLQDMVMAALADGTLNDAKAKPIEKMAKVLRFVQADMDMAAMRAQRRLDTLRTPQMAAPLPPPVPRPAAAPSRTPDDKLERETAPASPAPAATDEPARPVPGVDALPPQARPQAVETCMRCRASSTDPESYCFGSGGELNVWGCRLLRQPWRPGAAWLSAGVFRPSGCFVFDREAIEGELAEGRALAAGCPCFSASHVAHALAALPSRAWPGRRWRPRRSEEGNGREYMLTVRQSRHGCVLHARQPVSGVEPVGDALARRVIRDACRAGGRTMPELALRS